MPTLPTSLKSDDTIKSIVPWSKEIIDYLRAITVRPSTTVKVSTTSNGTLLTAAGNSTKANGQYSYTGEFALFLDGSTLKVSEGTVCVNGMPVEFHDDITCNSRP